MSNNLEYINPNFTLLRRLRRQQSIEKYRRLLLRQWSANESSILEQCEIRPAQNYRELKASSQLALRECNRENSSVPYNGRLWFTMAKESRRGITIVAIYKKKYVLGTLTFIFDSSHGLPMDRVFRRDLQKMRSMGRTLAETTMLSFNREVLDDPAIGFSVNDRMALLLEMFKVGFEFVNSCSKADTIVTCFSPKHEKFFKALLFQPLGGLRYYAGIDRHFAPGYFLDLSYLNRNTSGILRKLYGFNTSKKDWPKNNKSLMPLENLYLVEPGLAS